MLFISLNDLEAQVVYVIPYYLARGKASPYQVHLRETFSVGENGVVASIVVRV